MLKPKYWDQPGSKPYSNQKSWSNDYLTDPKIVKGLGRFDVDVCCPATMPWRTARRMIQLPKDGLKEEWKGRAWMNPPYRGVLSWARKFAEHCDGICLLNGRSTETRATQLIMERSRCIFFPKGRLVFYRPNGQPWEGKWFPSLLIGMRARDLMALEELRDKIGGVIYQMNHRGRA